MVKNVCREINRQLLKYFQVRDDTAWVTRAMEMLTSDQIWDMMKNWTNLMIILESHFICISLIMSEAEVIQDCG